MLSWKALRSRVESDLAENGRNLIKLVRTYLIGRAQPLLEAMIQVVTGAKVLSLHHDINTVTGEVVGLFTLAEAPRFRETKGSNRAR